MVSSSCIGNTRTQESCRVLARPNAPGGEYVPRSSAGENGGLLDGARQTCTPKGRCCIGWIVSNGAISHSAGRSRYAVSPGGWLDCLDDAAELRARADTRTRPPAAGHVREGGNALAFRGFEEGVGREGTTHSLGVEVRPKDPKTGWSTGTTLRARREVGMNPRRGAQTSTAGGSSTRLPTDTLRPAH
jgi:hypothetical protein